MGESVLTVDGLSKKFGDKVVLRDVSFSVPSGSVVGFVGKNGAGKTTTIKIALGLMRADGGTVAICGDTVSFGQTATSHHVGYLPDVPEFYGYMRPKEYLRLNAEVSGIAKEDAEPRIEELLGLVGLTSNKKISTFSRGMKQRLGVAQALIGNPKLLVCDEPTSALDPIGRRELLELLRDIKDQTTVLFSTHILSDVERICDQVVLLDDGEVKYEGAVQTLKSRYRKDYIEIEFTNDTEAKQLTKALDLRTKRTSDVEVIVYCDDIQNDYKRILKALANGNIVPTRINMAEPVLEDIFMEIAK